MVLIATHLNVLTTVILRGDKAALGPLFPLPPPPGISVPAIGIASLETTQR